MMHSRGERLEIFSLASIPKGGFSDLLRALVQQGQQRKLEKGSFRVAPQFSAAAASVTDPRRSCLGPLRLTTATCMTAMNLPRVRSGAQSVVENVRRFSLLRVPSQLYPERAYGEASLTDSTTFGLHGVTLESPMLNHSFPLRTNAVLRGGHTR